MIILATSLLLTGCANNAEQASSSENSTSQSENQPKDTNGNKTVKNDEERKEKPSNNPQAPDDSTLMEVGDYHEDGDGSLTLKAISDYYDTTKIGNVKVTFSGVKVMNYSPSMDLIDFFHPYSEDETNFNYVNLNVTVKNTSDQPVNFAPVSVLETNDGEKKGYEEDFYLEELYGNLEANEERSGEMGFVLNEANIENLSRITVKTSDVFDENKESQAKAKTIEIPIEGS